MNSDAVVFAEVAGLYRVVPLSVLRRTPGVSFDNVPLAVLPRIDAIDRVIHQHGAISPGEVGDVGRPWYMHPCQDDNLIVLHGTRYVDLYTPECGQIESFVVMPHSIRREDRVVCDGPAMLVWPRHVFHRIRSCDREGSASLNFAVHYPGFDIRTNFNIYDVDPATGRYGVIREGLLDQPTG